MTRSASRLALILFFVGAAIHTDPVPKAVVRGRVDGPPGQSLPRELLVRIRPTLELVGNEDRFWETASTCPIRDGEWRCEVPAGRVDLRITGTAVMPIYRWGLSLRAGMTEDLGTLKLRRGATLSGWVRLEEQVLTHSVLISLLPQREDVPILEWNDDTLQTVRMEEGSRPWGFFRFDGLKPRSYALVVQQAGLPPVRLGPIEIEGEKPVELPSPVQLTRPLQVHGEIWPTKAGLQNWQVQLTPLPSPIPNDPFKDLHRLVRDLGYANGHNRGFWHVEGLAAGDYELSVIRFGELGSWRTEKIHVDPRHTVFDFDIPVFRFKGQVLYRGEPLAAEVWFRSEKSSFRLASNETGELLGDVPAGNSWKVAVVAPAQGLKVALQDPVRTRFFNEIVVPDTRLSVQVVNEKGQPVEGATVTVEGDPPNQMTTDKLGVCLFRGLSPGPQKLKATGEPFRESGTLEVLLRDQAILTPARLMLPERVEILGRVVPHFGTAPGAEVYVWPRRKPGERLTEFFARTGEGGRFRLGLPPGVRGLNLLVMASGQALRKTQIAIDPRNRLEVPVDTPGGTLVLEMPEAALKAITRPPVENHGISSLPFLLRHWADLQGASQTPGSLVVPNVEPGIYSLCAGAQPEVRWGKAPAGDRPCVSGALEAGGELRLSLPGTTPAAPPRSSVTAKASLVFR